MKIFVFIFSCLSLLVTHSVLAGTTAQKVSFEVKQHEENKNVKNGGRTAAENTCLRSTDVDETFYYITNRGTKDYIFGPKKMKIIACPAAMHITADDESCKKYVDKSVKLDDGSGYYKVKTTARYNSKGSKIHITDCHYTFKAADLSATM